MSYAPHIIQREDGSYYCVILHPDKTGSTSFTFSDLEYVRRSEINAVVEASSLVHGPDEKNVENMIPVEFSCRLNLMSQSGRDSYARSMGRIAKNKQEYDSYLSAAITSVIKAIQAKPRMTRLFDGEMAPEKQWLLEPYILDKAPNVFFGEGSGGKTYVALRWLISLATGIPFLGHKPARVVPCMFLDYEDEKDEAIRRVTKLCGSTTSSDGEVADLDLAHENIHHFNPEGIPIHELIPQLKEQISKFKIEFILIDSAVYACGGEPEKADVVSRYFNDLAKLGVTTLTIAHETKNENHDHVFGSIFWRNCPRNIWNAQSEKDPTDNRRSSMGLFHRKCNHAAPYAPIPIRIFHGDGYVEIERGQAEEWGGKSLTVGERIISVLRSGPKQFGQIVEAMQREGEVKKDVVTMTLTRLKSRGILSQRTTGSQEWEIA